MPIFEGHVALEKVTYEGMCELIRVLGRPAVLVIPPEDWEKILQIVNLVGRDHDPRGPFFWVLGTRIYPADSYDGQVRIKHRLTEDK